MLKVMTIYGNPEAKKRHRHSGKHAYASAAQKAAEGADGLLMGKAVKEPLKGTLLLVCIFYRKSHHIIDTDNLLKHVKDAGNKVCWKDDSQIVAEYDELRLDRDNPRTVIGFGPKPSSMVRGG